VRTPAPEPDSDQAAAEILAARLVERGRARLEAARARVAQSPGVTLSEAKGRESGHGNEEGELDQLVGWLVQFHRRDEKPMWWRKFKRHEMSVEERYDDPDCLAALTRTSRPTWSIKQSKGFEYRWDTGQETKLHPGNKCFIAGTDMTAEIVAMDEDEGLIELKSTDALPDRLCLIPNELVDAKTIKKAIARFAAAWERGEIASQAVDDLLRRRPPRIAGGAAPGAPLLDGRGEFLAEARALVSRLGGTTLCIQGPPGTGKTWNAAGIIADLLRQGRRIGVTAQSHKVILHLVASVKAALAREGVSAPLCKVVSKPSEESYPTDPDILTVESKDARGVVGDGAVLLGGTYWVFCRDEMVGALDYLFVDEAGQVPLASAVAVGQSARNLILVGDQMQLAQPTQGTHPGDTGLSCLEYLLQGRATVPRELGLFLERTRRMHPDVCRFISDAIYDGRLESIPETARHRVVPDPVSSHPERSEGAMPQRMRSPHRRGAARPPGGG